MHKICLGPSIIQNSSYLDYLPIPNKSFNDSDIPNKGGTDTKTHTHIENSDIETESPVSGNS